MPGKVKVQILAGRNLPVMDKTNETSDAYVEVKLGGTTYKTDVCKKSLNPVWNSEWFKFEMDDEELQDEPLQIRIMDHDTYSANDAIGKVYIDLNPLLLSANSGSSMSGWIPIYDTMHGIRGEISLIVKVDYFCDFNRFRQSSCGVQFFCCPGVPHGYRLHIIHGFVEELISNEDPEYHWMDKLRTPRASNEARQTVFAKLSGEVQRRIGLKALELGGNSVIGYKQCFDLEGESGVTVRGIGTAVTLVRVTQDVQSLITSAKEVSQESLGLENTSSDPIPLYFCCSVSPLSSKALNVFKQSPVKYSNILINGNELKSNRTSRLRLYSTSQGLSSFRSRLMLPPPTTRCFNRFRQRSQSSSAAMQDEKSVALNQFIMQHNSRELYSSTTTLTPSSLTSDVQNDDSVFHDSANDFVLSPCAFDSSGHVSPTSLDINHEHCSSTCLSCVAAASDYSVLCNGDLHSKCASQQGFLSTSPLCRRSPLPEDTPGSPVTLTPNKLSQSPVKPNIPCVCRRSSDSELNVSTKGVGNGVSSGGNKTVSKPSVQAENIEMLEYPFLSMTQFPSGFIIHLGGVVAAQSVKLLGRVNNPEELESRDAWWKEIRMEIRSHARALGCNVVLGYSEATSICDDICVLSASGTAAIVCMHHPETDSIRREFHFTIADKKESDRERSPHINCFPGFGPGKPKHLNESEDPRNYACSICHIPYSESSIPFAVSLTRCSICKKSKVPDVLFTTISSPIGIPITGKGCLIQARVCKVKKEGKGEINAKEISDSLPFLQFELHRQLLNKLKMKGMNGLFDLRIQLSVSAKMLIAIATATAVYLTALPPQQLPKISSGKNLDDMNLQEMQKMIAEAVKRNCDFYNITPLISDFEHKMNVQEEVETESDDDENERPDLDLTIGNKDVCVLEMDDSEDADIISLLIDPNAPEGFEMVNSEFVPGIDNIACNLQMFTRMCRSKLSSGSSLTSRQLSQYCDNVIQSLFFKLRKMIPCALCNLQFKVELPEDDEIQVTLLGMALGIKETCKPSKSDIKSSGSQHYVNFTSPDSESVYSNIHQTSKMKGEIKTADSFYDKKFKYHLPIRERYGIDITPLSYIPGIVIERYLGKLSFFFIRESTSIKEFGGMSGFVQSFIADVMAIIRAHVAALGGNALLSYFLNEYVLLQNPHKNQGQCLINVGGDVVQVTSLQHLHEPLKISTNEEMSTIKIIEGSPKELKKSPISRLFPLKRGLHKKSFHPLGFLTP